jgi:molecular chaperone GrpE
VSNKTKEDQDSLETIETTDTDTEITADVEKADVDNSDTDVEADTDSETIDVNNRDPESVDTVEDEDTEAETATDSETVDVNNRDPESVDTVENNDTDAETTTGEEETDIDSTQNIEKELETLREQVNRSNDQLLRLQAEVQNVRRRAERDVQNAHKYGLNKFATELLAVVDNLERALATIDDENETAVAEGIELTLKTFIEVLSRFHIKEINPKGEPFDAELHQAVSTVCNAELEANSVMEVFQKGYTLNDRLIRPAMVVVSKLPDKD